MAGANDSTAIHSRRDHGTAHGYDDNTNRPDHPVDRGQMAVYVARGFDLPQPRLTVALSPFAKGLPSAMNT
jgi:hypothetical protein